VRIIKEKKIGDRVVQIKELTLAEIRAWLADQGEGDVVDAMLFDDCSLRDLTRLTDLQAAALEELAPSEIEELVNAAREVNWRFFAMREKIVALGRDILAQQAAPSSGSSAASPA